MNWLFRSKICLARQPNKRRENPCFTFSNSINSKKNKKEFGRVWLLRNELHSSSQNSSKVLSATKQTRERERERVYELEVVEGGFGDEGTIGGEAVALQLIDHLRHVGRQGLPAL